MNNFSKKEFNFSVIMAIYNVEKYLEEAILSLINQTLNFTENIQLILINDGSPDNSYKICEKYKKIYPNNILYIYKSNGGVSSARNEGLKVATGKYINFLDSDDYFSKDAFEKVLTFFDNYSDKTDVVALNLINFENAEGSWINGYFFEKTQLIDMQKQSNFIQCQVGASFIKSNLAKKYLFDTKIKIHEDSHYLYKIFSHNSTCGVISDATYWHRIRANGSSATQTINNKENIFNITEYVFNDLIKFYINKYNFIPNYLQTFILLEFNFYVIEKIQKCEFNKSEIEKIIYSINYLFNNIAKINIINHFALSNEQKQVLLILKSNVNKLKYFYNKEYFKFYNTPFTILKKIILRPLLLILKFILYIPKKILKYILRNILNRLDLNETNINNLINENNKLKEKINKIEKVLFK